MRRSVGSTAEVVVVGAGIVGVAITHALARAGHSVVLIDRGTPCSGTSGRCMGHLMVVPRPDALHRLTRQSVEAWRDLARSVPGVEIQPTGCLWLAESESDVETLASMHRQFAAFEQNCEWLEPAALLDREPGLARDLKAGLHYPFDGVLVPMRALASLLRRSRQLGARVLTETEVVGVRADCAGVQAVRTTRGEISSRAVVVAAGVASPRLTERMGIGRVPVVPRRGELAVTVSGDCPIAHQLLEVGYLRSTGADHSSSPIDPGDWALNVQPQANGTCLIGSTRQFAGYETRVHLGLLRRSLERAVRFVPSLASARVARSWAGLRPASADQLPWIGPVDEVPGLLLATGHEGLGITLSAITGELICAAVEGRPQPEIGEPFLPTRDRLFRCSPPNPSLLASPW